MSAFDGPAEFYDQLADDYHLIFADWDAAVVRQQAVLSRLLAGHGVISGAVLDASCGIGTQAIGLARAGFTVTASDISPVSVQRCSREAAALGLRIATQVADIRELGAVVGAGYDAVVSFDNALPHLLDDADLRLATRAIRRVLRPGGLAVASIRSTTRSCAIGPQATCPVGSLARERSESRFRSGTGSAAIDMKSVTSSSRPVRTAGRSPNAR